MLFVERLDSEAAGPYVLHRLYKSPLKTTGFCLEQFHLGLAEKPDAHIRAECPAQAASVDSQVAALLIRMSAGLPWRNLFVESQQVEKVGLIKEDFQSRATWIFA
jgi:hypothetical protein